MKRQAISVLSLFVFAGCKPSVSEGRLASIDNFAGTGNKKSIFVQAMLARALYFHP
jgi:hypothetical protein